MESIKIILSTTNPTKAEQVALVFAGMPITVQSLKEAGIEGEAVEDGTTLLENSRKKALFAWEKVGGWCMADDTGLFIESLGGKPGIWAARWAGLDATTEDTMRYTLDQMQSYIYPDRTAIFKTVAILIDPDGAQYIFDGEASGSILAAPQVACQPKMPYSAIFVPDGQQNGVFKTWAEMSIEEENALSHRGKAFGQMKNFFEDMFV